MENTRRRSSRLSVLSVAKPTTKKSNSSDDENIYDVKKTKRVSSKNCTTTPKKKKQITNFDKPDDNSSSVCRRSKRKASQIKFQNEEEEEDLDESVGYVLIISENELSFNLEKSLSKMEIKSPKKSPQKQQKCNPSSLKKTKSRKSLKDEDFSMSYKFSEDEDNSSIDSESNDEITSEQENEEPNSQKYKPRKTKKLNLNKKSKPMLTTPVKTPLKRLPATPSMHQRISNIQKPSTPLQEARIALHVSAVPKSLPCREEEFNNIFTFLKTRLSENSGGCIYVSGVPGTGKTATVNEVIKCLNKCVKNKSLQGFDFVDINGMKLSEPHQAYVQIYKQLTGETRPWEEAQSLLNKKFTTTSSKNSMTLLLVDELDMLCTKRQDVVYNLLDWPSKVNAKLLVITIANTMDLPERSLMGRVTSRLGLTRVTFHPYDFKQLQEIVLSRLKISNSFNSDAVQFVARKVASVSGDARRALDICRRATEIAEDNNNLIVSMKDVNQALSEMIANVKVQAIKNCSLMEQYFLKAICSEVNRTGIEEVIFKNVYQQLITCCTFDGEKVPNVSQALGICSRLSSWRLIICEHSREDIFQKIILNVSPDDIHFALSN